MSSPVSAASTFFVEPELGADEVVVDVDLLEIDELVVDGPAEPRTPPWLGCRPKHAIIAPDDTKSGFTGYGGVLVLATLPQNAAKPLGGKLNADAVALGMSASTSAAATANENRA